MKMFTNNEQTAKLIELGLLPKRIQSVSDEGKMLLELIGFSIGELIEMLGYDLYSILYTGLAWVVKSERVETRENELIDALYDMCVKLKEEGIL